MFFSLLMSFKKSSISTVREGSKFPVGSSAKITDGEFTNALAIAIADWKEGYMVVDRLGISVLRDPYTDKPFVGFYFTRRVGGDVFNFDAIKLGKIAA